MDVSIIIVNYNTKKLTSECIESIVEKTKGVEYEIIVVDNASTDGSKELFEQDNRITYINNKTNGGFGYGNNRGMEVAKGKFFFLLNSDTLLQNNAIKEFFDYAESHHKVAVYCCYLTGGDGKYTSSFHYFPAFTIKDFLIRQLHLKKYLPIDYKNKEVECVCGADMFVHRSIIDQIGMFDENIFLYGEEGEWQYRMAKGNIHRYIINTPKIIHLEGKSMQESVQKTKIRWKSHFYVLKKHCHPITYLLARIYYAILLTILYLPKITKGDGKSLLKTIYG